MGGEWFYYCDHLNEILQGGVWNSVGWSLEFCRLSLLSKLVLKYIVGYIGKLAVGIGNFL